MLKTHRGALMALGAATLLAALVFLFVKTAGTEFRHDAQSLNLLREMRDLDNHWDDDSARMVNDFSNTGTQADFPAMIGRLLSEVDRSATHEAFRREIAGVRTSLEDKTAAFKAFRDAHRGSFGAARVFEQDLASFERLAAA